MVTMFQNLSAYEKIFSRSHANYLAQLQVESFNSNLTVTNILGNVTLIGTMLLPLNVITGIFGMNVNVIGADNRNWFWGICGFMLLLFIGSFLGGKIWLKKMEGKEQENESLKKSIRSFSLKKQKREKLQSLF